MTRNLLPTLLVVLTLGMFFLLVMGQYERTYALLMTREEVQEAKESFNKLKELKAEYQERMEGVEEQYELMNKFILSHRNDARTMMRINERMNDNNIDLDGFSIEESSWGGGQTRVAEVSLDFETSYDNLLDLWEYLEHDLRQFDVVAADIQSERFGTYGVDMSIRSYHWNN